MIKLRDLQLCQLDIALEIKRICDENNSCQETRAT